MDNKRKNALKNKCCDRTYSPVILDFYSFSFQGFLSISDDVAKTVGLRTQFTKNLRK